MNSTYYILALLATVTIVTAAMLLSRDSMPISGTTTPRPVPGPPAAVDASLPEHRLLKRAITRSYRIPIIKRTSERWKSCEISDWQIYQHARGASVIDGHRRYEAMLQLDEIGLHRGVPFPAWADAETDPHQDPSEKSTSRRYVGQMGAQTAPVWFVIE